MNPTITNPNADYFKLGNGGNPVPMVPSVADASAVQSSSPLNLMPPQPVPPVPNVSNLPTSTPSPEATKTNVSTPTVPTTDPTSSAWKSAFDKVTGLFSQSKNKTADTATAVDTATSPIAKQINDLSTQIQMHQADAIANQEKAMQSGETSGFASREAQNVARTDAIQTLRDSAVLAGLQGNYALAERHATALVDAKYAQIQSDIEEAKTNIYNNFDSFTSSEKKQAEQTLLRLDANDAFVKTQKEEDKAINDIGIKLAGFGVDTQTIQKVMNAGSIDEAIALAGSKMQDPKDKVELENIKLDMALKKEEIKYKQKQTALLGEPTETEKKAVVAAMKESKSSIPVMQDKIAAVDVLNSAPGLSSRVGTGILSRSPQGVLGTVGKALTVVGLPGLIGDTYSKLTGSGQDFAGGVHKLVGGLTLQSLIDAKSRGATFGALSEGELNILANSASALNDWEEKDDKGNGTGFWNIDEKSFKKELDTIKTLTQRALTISQGQLLSPDEESLIDTIYQQTAPTPEQYFNN